MLAEKLEEEVIKELKAYGFALVKAEGIRSIPKVIAQKNAQRLVIKVVANIDAVSESDASILYKIAKFMDSTPIIIGAKSQNGKLERNVSYTRFSVECISSESLSAYLSSPKRYFASKNVSIKRPIDSARLRQLRRIKGMTIKELANALHVSASTIYKYEHTSSFASEKILHRLEDFFGEDLTANSVPEEGSEKIEEKRLGKSEIRSVELNNAPFALLAKGRNYYPIAGEADTRTLLKRAAFFKGLMDNFSDIYPFFLGKAYTKIGDITVIPKKQLNELTSEDELLELI